MSEQLDLDELMWRMTGARGIGKDSIDMPISEIGALIARIRELESASQPGGGWQPIETATRDGKRMLLMATHHQMLYPKPEMIVGYYDKGWWSNGGHTLSHVTHWMPLPAAPSAGNGGAEGDGNA